jgi:hypothetical protein
MSQVITPEEMAALFEGLRETGSRPDSRHGGVPQDLRSSGRVLLANRGITGCHNLADWLLSLVDLHWPHL